MDDPLRNGIPETEEHDGGDIISSPVDNEELRLPTPQQPPGLPPMSQASFVHNLNSGERGSSIPEGMPVPQESNHETAEGNEEDPSRRESVGAQTLRSEESSDSRTGLMPLQRDVCGAYFTTRVFATSSAYFYRWNHRWLTGSARYRSPSTPLLMPQGSVFFHSPSLCSI